jgi:hypothetical protein
VERRAGRELDSLLGLGAISGSESASSKIPRHSSTACLPYWPLSCVPNGQQHLDLCSWFLSSTIPACQCSSIALPLFTFTSFIVYYSLRSFIHCAAVCPRCLHHESSRQPFANLVFLPRPLPPDLSPSATQAHSVPPSIHQRLRNLHNCLDHKHPR